jgi:acyl-CoA thioester hydrolase
MPIDPAWVDYNGHLNMAYYNLLFDRALDEAYLRIGFGPEYVRARGASLFTVEVHTSYLREIGPADAPVVVGTQLLGHDEKRLRIFQTMRPAGGDFVSAAAETLALHVDMATRRAAPFAGEALLLLDALVTAHKALPWPDRAGRAIAGPGG